MCEEVVSWNSKLLSQSTFLFPLSKYLLLRPLWDLCRVSATLWVWIFCFPESVYTIPFQQEMEAGADGPWFFNPLLILHGTLWEGRSECTLAAGPDLPSYVANKAAWGMAGLCWPWSLHQVPRSWVLPVAFSICTWTCSNLNASIWFSQVDSPQPKKLRISKNLCTFFGNINMHSYMRLTRVSC